MALTADNITRPESPRTLTRSVALSLLGQVAFVLFSILSGVLAARLLGPGGKGQLATVFTAAILTGYWVSLGFDQAVIRVIANGHAGWRSAVSTVLVLYGLLCVILLPTAAILLSHYHQRLFPGIPLPVLYVGLAIVPLRMIIGSLNGALAGHHLLPEASVLQSVQVIGSSLALVLLVWVWRFGVLGGIIAQTAGIVIGIIVAFFLLRRVAPGRWCIHRQIIPEILRFGRGCYAATIAQSLNWRFDNLLVFYLVGKESVGLYTVAVAMAEFPQYLPTSIANVLMPRVSGESLGMEERTARLSRVSLFILLLASGALLLVGYPLIRLLYGAAFQDAFLAMALLLPGLLALGQSRILSAEITGRGFPRYTAAGAWVSLIVAIGLDLWLIPRWGITGAAFGATVSYLAGSITIFYYYRRLTGVGFRELLVIRPAEIREICVRLFQSVLRSRQT